MSRIGQLHDDTLRSQGDEREPARPQAQPCLTLVFHPELDRVGERALLDWSGPVEVSRLEPRFAHPRARAAGHALENPYLSREPLVIRRKPGRIELDARRTRDVVIDGVALSSTTSVGSNELARGVVIEIARRVVLLLHEARPTPDVEAMGLVGASDRIEEVREAIARVADLDVPVLIRGDTGVGKERVAAAIHDHSLRPEGPFVAVNMGAIPEATAASQLFGHARGAFTGAATKHVGFFESAHGGTLFLDEIAETPAVVQPMLLRALEISAITPLGASNERSINVRYLAATDADLDRATEEGSFRAALFHRLSGITLNVPPLRERRDDIARLFVHFLAMELEGAGESHRLEPADPRDRPWIPAELIPRLLRADWPGNVRQLRNVVRELVVANRGQQDWTTDKLDQLLSDETSPAHPHVEPKARRNKSDLSNDDVIEALRANAFAIAPTAVALQVPRSTLYELIKRIPELRPARSIPRDELAQLMKRYDADLDVMANELMLSLRALQLRLKELELL